METTNITLIKLTSSDGMVLTNGEIYGKEIYLGCNDKVENYHEITDEEYTEILKKMEEDAENTDHEIM